MTNRYCEILIKSFCWVNNTVNWDETDETNTVWSGGCLKLVYTAYVVAVIRRAKEWISKCLRMKLILPISVKGVL